MANLTTRSLTTSTVSTANLNKGSALTIAEMDSNFLNLNTDKIDSTGPQTFSGDLTITTGTSNAVGSIIFKEAADNGTNTITLKANTSMASDLNFILPPDAGSNGYGLTTDGSGNLSWTESAGDITAVIAGDGLTGGATSGSATINVVGGTGIDANADDISIDDTVVATLSGSQTLANKTLTTPIISSISNTGTLTLPTSTDTLVGRATTDTLTNKTLTSPVLNTGVSGTAIKDEDNMASDSDTHLATQQSIKAYVDSQVATKDTIAELNDVDTTGIANNKILKYNSTSSNWEMADESGGSGIALTDLSVGAEGTAAGDGSLAYNNSTGVFTYTPPVLSGLSGDTDDIAEGSTNLYYTNSRVNSYIQNSIEIGELSNVDETGVANDKILKYNSTTSNWEVADDSGGIALTDLSVGAEGTASGDGAIAYNNSTGVFTYTPPTLAGLGGIADVVSDTTPQLGGDLDTNGFELTASATGEIRLGDGANKYASVDLSADKLVLSNIGLDMVSENITTSATDEDIKLRPNGTGGIKVGITDTDVAIKTNGSGALTLQTSGGNKDITLTPNGTGTSYVQAMRVNSATFAHMPQLRRQSTAQTGYALEVANDSTSTNIAAGQPGGCFGFTHYSDNYSNYGGNAYYPGSINAIIGDEGTLDGSAGENNNAIRLYTYEDQASFGLNNVGEFRYASANFMKETLKFDNTSNVITIEAATTNDDLTLKTSGTGDITLNPSGTGKVKINNTLDILGNDITSSTSNVVISADATDKEVHIKVDDAGGTNQTAAEFRDYSFTENATDGDTGTAATVYKPVLDLPHGLRIGDSSANFSTTGDAGNNNTNDFNQRGVTITNGDDNYWPDLSIVSYGGANPLLNKNGSSWAGGLATNFPSASINFKGAAGTISSPAAQASGKTIGILSFTGHDGTQFGGTGSVASATLTVTANETFSTSNARGGKVRLDVTPTGGAATDGDETGDRIAGFQLVGSEFTINPDSKDLDFVVNGDTVDDIIKVDAANESFSSASAKIDFTNLPTSDPAVAGRLWNDSGTLKVSAG